MTSAIDLLRESYQDFKRRPVRALFGLGLLPSCLVVLSNYFLESLRVQLGFAASYEVARILTIAVGSLGLGGQILFGLELVRGGAGRFGALVRGAQFAIPIFAVTLAMSEIWHGLRATTQLFAAHKAIGSVVGLINVLADIALTIRTITWLPLIVDRRLPLMEAVRRSIVETRGKTFLIARISATLGIPIFIVLLILYRHPLAQKVVLACSSPIVMITFCRLYIALETDYGSDSGVIR
jgi:hypothetical protein